MAFLVNLVDVDGNNGVATYTHVLFEKVESKTELINQSKKIYFIMLLSLLYFICTTSREVHITNGRLNLKH